MRLLAVETSCDDSAVAILDETGTVLAELVSTQMVHEKHGGVVPEIASRLHMTVLPKLIREVLEKSGTSLDSIDVFAATAGPGLTGSLLVGLSWTKAAAFALGKPFLGINHLSAHLHIHHSSPVEFPAVALLVSGGHTMIFHMLSWNECLLLGTTRDDAAGEAFDKTAKLMGLGYPGGRIIDELAEFGNPDSVKLPSPLGNKRKPEFSFSGLKTAFLYFIRDRLKENKDFIKQNRNDLCASIQRTIVEILTDKLEKAFLQTGISEIALAGGVSANSGLRERIKWLAKKHGWKVFIPEISLSTDNAAMIAMTGYLKFLAGEFAGLDSSPLARLPI